MLLFSLAFAVVSALYLDKITSEDNYYYKKKIEERIEKIREESKNITTY